MATSLVDVMNNPGRGMRVTNTGGGGAQAPAPLPEDRARMKRIERLIEQEKNGVPAEVALAASVPTVSQMVAQRRITTVEKRVCATYGHDPEHALLYIDDPSDYEATFMIDVPNAVALELIPFLKEICQVKVANPALARQLRLKEVPNAPEHAQETDDLPASGSASDGEVS